MSRKLIWLVLLTLGACWPGQDLRGAEARQIRHPDDASKQVEFFVETPAGKGPWPAVVLLHGHQDMPRRGGKDFVEWGTLKSFAERGYLAVAISQPGYGA